jgi:citrate lyase subunit beta-like protein
VPGDDDRKVNKAQQLNVDCVALDCEDGVALNRKVAARETIRKFFDQPKRATNTNWAVRVNSVESGELDADLRCLLASGPLPDTLLLPKVESVDDLDFFNATLCKYKRPNHQFKLIFYTESCKSMLSLPKICEHARTLSTNDKLFEPIAIVCGGDDLVASLGAQKSPKASELNYARQYCVLVSKAFQLQAIDIVFIEYKS